MVEELAAAPDPAYGISTGFGALATRHIPTEMRAQLQRSLVRSHAAGSGPEVEREVVRALMLLRLSTLATGRTGVRPETAQLLADPARRTASPLSCRVRLARLLRRPAPLSHCALALMGEGEVRAPTAARWPQPRSRGGRARGRGAGAKEGLALINGTDGMLGMLVLALPTSHLLPRHRAAMSVESSSPPRFPDLQALRPHIRDDSGASPLPLEPRAGVAWDP